MRSRQIQIAGKREALLMFVLPFDPLPHCFSRNFASRTLDQLSLKIRAEIFVFKEVALGELSLHLEKFISADCVNVTAFQLLFEDLWNRNLAEVCAHTQEVPVNDKSILVVLHLRGELRRVFLLRGELFLHTWNEISVCTTHYLTLYIIIILAIN